MNFRRISRLGCFIAFIVLTPSFLAVFAFVGYDLLDRYTGNVRWTYVNQSGIVEVNVYHKNGAYFERAEVWLEDDSGTSTHQMTNRNGVAKFSGIDELLAIYVNGDSVWSRDIPYFSFITEKRVGSGIEFEIWVAE